MLFWLLLTGCLEPFGTDRHDLEGFRVAGVRVSAAESGVSLEPLVVVDGKLWSDDAVELRWFAVDDASEASELDVTQTPIATGSPAVVADTEWAVLVATSPSGVERRAVVQLPNTSEAPLTIDQIRVDEVDATLAELGALVPTLEERQQWTSERAGLIAPRGIARFIASSNTSGTEPQARWMTLAGAGHYLELDRSQTDWFAAELDIDDEDLLGHTALGEGWVTGVTVLVDGAGGSDWRVFEVFVGTELPATGSRVTQRFLPIEPPPTAAGLVQGTLELDDASPTGVRLTGATTVSLDDLNTDDPYGTGALPCGSDAPFEPDWLAGARCTRAEVSGAVVVVEAR